MQYTYKNYVIQNNDENLCIIRDSKGKYLMTVADDDEAKEYINDLIADGSIKKSSTVSPQFLYRRFEQYCRNGKLIGMCYPFDNSKFGTAYIKVLSKFIHSFEKENNVTILVDKKYIDGETIYIVDDIVTN